MNAIFALYNLFTHFRLIFTQKKSTVNFTVRFLYKKRSFCIGKPSITMLSGVQNRRFLHLAVLECVLMHCVCYIGYLYSTTCLHTVGRCLFSSRKKSCELHSSFLKTHIWCRQIFYYNAVWRRQSPNIRFSGARTSLKHRGCYFALYEFSILHTVDNSEKTL